MNTLHNKTLKEFPKIPLKLSSLKIEGAKPYTAALGRRDKLMKVVEGELVEVVEDTQYTHSIGAEFDLAEGGRIKIDIEGQPDFPLVLPSKSGANVSIEFDNDCHNCGEEGYNDFYLYYDVLDGGDTRVYLEPSDVQMYDLMMACNPIEGGDGGS